VFSFIIEYTSLMDFCPLVVVVVVVDLFFIWGFLKDDILSLCWNLRLVMGL
jgi:hypothetical protein